MDNEGIFMVVMAVGGGAGFRVVLAVGGVF